jgi:transposase
MKPATHTLGTDIAKDKFDVNLRPLADCQQRHAASFNNDLRGFELLLRWLLKHAITNPGQVHVCLESTSRYGDALARFLYRHGFQVSMVNPRRTRNYADSQLTRTVNDTIDARIIADFCASERADLRLWEPLSDDHAQLRDLTRARQALVQQRDAFGNLLETATGMARKIYQKQFRALDRQITQLEKLIKKFSQEVLSPEFLKQIELADSVIGVGFITAATVVAELPPINKIPQADQAVALLGLDPVNKTSGQTVHTRARLSRMGSRYGRRALYMPALSALRFNPIIRDLGLRLQAKGRSGKYIVVAAMRKLLRLIFGVIKQGKPFDPNWSNPTAPHSKKQTAELAAAL